ncbi:aldo/keto reductase [Streptosporangium roseum]|uniref:aldo/keto reductase n=1 Tax=Streptosporangium roseum TaxID=2001 RepID=UPI00332DE55B
MKHTALRDLDVSRLGLGTMGMSFGYTGAGSDDAESTRTIHRALELGVTFLDTAEIYGPYVNEELVGRALKGRRDQVVVATKFGMVSHAHGGPGRLDSSPANIRTAVEGSFKRLGTDHIDLYYQHRVDLDTPIEDTVGALAELVEQGKIRHIGLSEAGPETIRRADAVHPVTAVQSEYSLWTRDVEERVLPVLREQRRADAHDRALRRPSGPARLHRHLRRPPPRQGLQGVPAAARGRPVRVARHPAAASREPITSSATCPSRSRWGKSPTGTRATSRAVS